MDKRVDNGKSDKRWLMGIPCWIIERNGDRGEVCGQKRELQGLMELTADAEVRVGEAESHEV